MDLYMTHVAMAANVDDLKIAFANILHKPPFLLDPPLNFDVFLFGRYDPRRGKSGILNLPTAEAGAIFLNAYGSSGVIVKGRPIHFQPSKNPVSGARVAQLISTPWKDPLELQRERERLISEGRPHALTQFAFGRFLADGKFISECTAEGDAEVACDMERREVRLTVRKQRRHSRSEGEDIPSEGEDVSSEGEDISEGEDVSSEGEDILSMMIKQFVNRTFTTDTIITASYSPQVVVAILEPREADSSVIFLSANTFPVFKAARAYRSVRMNGSRSRIQGLIQNRPMPPGCFSLMCTFSSDSDRDAFVHACKTRLRIHHNRRNSIPVVEGDASYDEGDLESLLARLPFGVAFELEKAVNNRVISITGALSLQDALLELCQPHFDHDPASILRKFTTYLEEGSIRRGRKHRRQHAPGDHTLVGRFRHTIDEYLEEQKKQKKRLAWSNPAASYTYQLTLTPTRHILEGPSIDQSNSVLRKFGNHECFLRVSFQDENGSKLRGDFETSISNLLADRYKPILLDGCWVAGREYRLLGYSMSGLREHSMWFVTPFKDTDGKKWDAEAIRNSLVCVFGHLSTWC